MFNNKEKLGIAGFFENLICGNVYSKEVDFIKFQTYRKKIADYNLLELIPNTGTFKYCFVNFIK